MGRLRLGMIVTHAKRFGISLILAGAAMAETPDAQMVWEQVIQAKGGRERLHRVQSLAIYMQPAAVLMAGPATNWLCVFPDRYFEYRGTWRGGGERVLVVDLKAGRAAEDERGIPRH